MTKAREIRLPQISLKQNVRDGDEIVSVDVSAKSLLLQALADSGGQGFELGVLRKRIRVSDAVEALKKNEPFLLDEADWSVLCGALDAHKWGWLHNDVLKVVDAVKEAESVEIESKKKKEKK